MMRINQVIKELITYAGSARLVVRMPNGDVLPVTRIRAEDASKGFCVLQVEEVGEAARAESVASAPKAKDLGDVALRAQTLDNRRVAKGLPSDLQWCIWMIAGDDAREAYLKKYEEVRAIERTVFAQAQPELVQLDMQCRLASLSRAHYRAHQKRERLLPQQREVGDQDRASEEP